MESFKKFVNSVLYPACLVFTVIVFLFSFMYEVADLNSSSAYGLTDLMLFFLFSLIFSYSMQVFGIKKMSYIKCLLLNFLCFAGNCVLVFFLIGRKSNFGGMVVFFGILYLIFAVVYSVVRKIYKPEDTEKKDGYKKMFR